MPAPRTPTRELPAFQLITPRQLMTVLILALLYLFCNVLGYGAVWAYAYLGGSF